MIEPDGPLRDQPAGLATRRGEPDGDESLQKGNPFGPARSDREVVRGEGLPLQEALLKTVLGLSGGSGSVMALDDFERERLLRLHGVESRHDPGLEVRHPVAQQFRVA